MAHSSEKSIWAGSGMYFIFGLIACRHGLSSRNGEFEMTTDSTNNSYVSNGKLYITPTFTSDSIGENAVENGYVYNITGCTYNATQGDTDTTLNQGGSKASTFDAAAYYRACSAISNSTTGKIINPVQTARLTTRQSANIKYGRVEVVAKLPLG